MLVLNLDLLLESSCATQRMVLLKSQLSCESITKIPTSGTEWSPSKDRAAEAVPPIELTELTAFTSLMKQACPVVSRLLGYREGKQPDDGIAPGGFATTIVWEKVPGVPLSQRFFWNLDKNQRDDIRSEFRQVYE